MRLYRRCAYLSLLILLGMCVLRLSGMRAAEAPQTESDSGLSAYTKKIDQTYIYPFGKGKMALPGNATAVGSNFLPASDFPTAAYCGHCHQAAYHQWRQSLHANSFRTPFYRTSVNILVRTKGIVFARHCDSCHNPIAVVSGRMTPGSQVDASYDRDGVTCMVCHSIESTASKLGNGSYVMGIPAVMVDKNGRPVPGIVPDSEIFAHLDRHAAAVMKPFYKSSEFCSGCHKANLPPELNNYKWIRAFSAYDEWQQSKFSQDSPLTYYTADYADCQDCHMMREPISRTDYGAYKGTLASHRWLAGNTAVPFYLGYKEQLKKTIDFLKSGNYLNVDIFALKIGGMGPAIEPLGSVPFTLKAGSVVEAYIVIQNKGAGHSLLPEVRDLYQAWVRVTVKDANGKVIYHSGFVNPDGTVDQRAHIFTNRPVNKAGSFVDDHMVWTIHSVAYDNTIQSGSSALVRYQFLIPKNVAGPVTITASVEYRHLRRSYLNNVFGKNHPAYPIVELASRTRTLNIGKNLPTAPQAGNNSDWMRWNNAGIAFVDELQYEYAMDAFEHVVKLRPKYKDGYVNLGLNYIAWEKYSMARAPLEKALALHPNDARALYYMALVERRARHTRAEVIDLEKVVAQYPDCREARRELGVSYYQQNLSKEAIAQFQALQRIDPDDLAAHYNLSILYYREGKRKLAHEQAELYSIKRIDPSAPTYSLDYLRKHPEISIESVPWHLHTDLKNGGLEAAGQQ
jgi:tetratricopeptide (TPR) repeat protein